VEISNFGCSKKLGDSDEEEGLSTHMKLESRPNTPNSRELPLLPARRRPPQVQVDFRTKTTTVKPITIKSLGMTVKVDDEGDKYRVRYTFKSTNKRNEPSRVDVTPLHNVLKNKGGLVDPFDESGIQRGVLKTVTQKLAAHLAEKEGGTLMEITMPTCFEFGEFGFKRANARTLPGTEGRLPMLHHSATAEEINTFLKALDGAGESVPKAVADRS
jgi:hypothetical protein